MSKFTIRSISLKLKSLHSMSEQEIINADKVFRNLYLLYKQNHLNLKAINQVFREEGLNNEDGRTAWAFLESENYVEIAGKADNEEDGFYVQLTKSGFSFFSKTNLVKELLQTKEKQQVDSMTINIHNHGHVNHVTDFGNTGGNHKTRFNPEKKEKSWYHEILWQIVGAILAFIVGIALYKLGFN